MKRILAIRLSLCIGLVIVAVLGASAQENISPERAFDILTEKGLIVNHAVDNSIMMDSIEKGNLEDVDLFLKMGINPNLTDNRGRLALAIAAKTGNVEIARSLVEAGASLKLTDKFGRTPMSLALSNMHDDLVKVLVKTQARTAAWENVSESLEFDYSNVTFETDLYVALSEATALYDGDMLIYFYKKGDESSAKMEQTVFGDETISKYINSNFGRLAVETGSELSDFLQKRYRPDSKLDTPFFVLDIRRSFSHSSYYGLENARNTSELENILQRLKFAKEHGTGLYK